MNLIRIQMPNHPLLADGNYCCNSQASSHKHGVTAHQHSASPGGGQCWRIIQALIVTDSMSVMNGIFPTAQTPEPTLFAPSVWAHMHTMPMPAMHPEHGMDSMRQWPRGRKMRYTCRKATPPSAWNSNCYDFISMLTILGQTPLFLTRTLDAIMMSL